MKKLIDAQSLKDRISEYTKDKDEYERFCQIVDDEPAAFDVDRVVEQLKEERELSYADFAEYRNRVCLRLHAIYDDFFHRGLERAIEIVKEGCRTT